MKPSSKSSSSFGSPPTCQLHGGRREPEAERGGSLLLHGGRRVGLHQGQVGGALRRRTAPERTAHQQQHQHARRDSHGGTQSRAESPSPALCRDGILNGRSFGSIPRARQRRDGLTVIRAPKRPGNLNRTRSALAGLHHRGQQNRNWQVLSAP